LGPNDQRTLDALVDLEPTIYKDNNIQALRTFVSTGLEGMPVSINTIPQSSVSKRTGLTRKYDVQVEGVPWIYRIGGFGAGVLHVQKQDGTNHGAEYIRENTNLTRQEIENWNEEGGGERVVFYCQPNAYQTITDDWTERHGLTHMGSTTINDQGHIVRGRPQANIGGYTIPGLEKKLRMMSDAAQVFTKANTTQLVDCGFIEVGGFKRKGRKKRFVKRLSGYQITRLPYHLNPADLIHIDFQMRKEGFNTNFFNWYMYRLAEVLVEARVNDFYWGGGHLGNGLIDISGSSDTPALWICDFESSRRTNKLPHKVEDAGDVFTGKGLAALVDVGIATQTTHPMATDTSIEYFATALGYFFAGLEGNPESEAITSFQTKYVEKYYAAKRLGEAYWPKALERLTEREFMERHGDFIFP